MKQKTPALFLALLLGACANFKAPSLSGDPASMSADTLCYRAAYARENQAVHNEIAARHLDCPRILGQRPSGTAF